MDKQLKKVYVRSIVGGVGCFLLFWAFFLFIANLNHQSFFLILRVGLIALACSITLVLGIVFSLKMFFPVFEEKMLEKRMYQYKKRHLSLKVVVLFTCMFSIFFTLLRLITSVSIITVLRFIFIGFSSGEVNSFAVISPFWLEPIAGLFIGLIAGLFAVIIIRFVIKNYENKDDDKRFGAEVAKG